LAVAWRGREQCRAPGTAATEGRGGCGKVQINSLFCKPICKPDAARQLETEETDPTERDGICPVRRGHRTRQRLPETAETDVVWLITQRRLAASARQHAATTKRNRRSETSQRCITRGTLSCLTCTSCTDITGHRTDSTRCAGIIRRRGPRTGPSPKASRLRGLRRCATLRTIRLLRLACRLQVVLSHAPNVLAAQMAQLIAPTAIAALGSADVPFHGGRWAPSGVITKRSDQGLAAAGRRRYAAPQTRPDGFLDGCRVARCPARSS
jgi:hypothetical protein